MSVFPCAPGSVFFSFFVFSSFFLWGLPLLVFFFGGVAAAGDRCERFSEAVPPPALQLLRREPGWRHPPGGEKWLRVKNRYPKWSPGKWQHGPKPVVPWWFNFDPYPHGERVNQEKTGEDQLPGVGEGAKLLGSGFLFEGIRTVYLNECVMRNRSR